MALSPSIPTSFVPKQPVAPAPREKQSSWNIFWIVAIVLIGVSLLGSGGVFFYERYLIGVKEAKLALLEKAKEDISRSSIEEFVRLRDRFTSARDILDNHIIFSHFLTVLETKTLTNVRFRSLTFRTNPEGAPKIELTGVARTFNALAAQSSAFNAERRIKRAIFSNITVNPNNTVSFTLTAELDPALLSMTLEDAPAPPAMAPPPSDTTPTEGTASGTPSTGGAGSPTTP